MTTTDTIAAAYRMAKVMMHRMIDDLAPSDFAHQPCPGANSATWILGHLAVTLRRTAIRLGAAALPEIPADLAAKFSQTKELAGNQSQLGEAHEVVALFDTFAEAVIVAVLKVTEETLKGPSPMVGPFATNYGEALLFGALHIAMHSGQLSTIRRSLGKPPLA